jgi:tetratricopeptide (TPR) repeat protein
MRAILGANKSSFAIVILFAIALGELPAFAANGEAAGRRHAAKANQLAAKNKCKSAVVEFTKAYKLLKDPTLLFNRAECQRQLGRVAEAIKDYEQFLADMPEAPNRTSDEARVKALKAEEQAVPPAAGAGQPAPESAKQADKAPPAPVHRAERWTD